MNNSKVGWDSESLFNFFNACGSVWVKSRPAAIWTVAPLFKDFSMLLKKRFKPDIFKKATAICTFFAFKIQDFNNSEWACFPELVKSEDFNDSILYFLQG